MGCTFANIPYGLRFKAFCYLFKGDAGTMVSIKQPTFNKLMRCKLTH